MRILEALSDLITVTNVWTVLKNQVRIQNITNIAHFQLIIIDLHITVMVLVLL